MASELDTERLALQLFRSLLDIDTASRVALDAELAQTDPAVAARVRAMLQRHRSTTDRLERPWRDAPGAMALPARLGAFTLTREIGRGGMGVVALGERQAEGFTQRVAIKWIPGAQFDPAHRARFLFERDVVARLQHPHIAQLVDGGEGEGGELWYAMELIDGSDLPTHCRQRRLDLRARIGLLLDLCDAVAHAHRHSILHRDIKPGNVLVTPDGQLKLIDFGIAKALDGEGADLTHEAAPMTPRYAAPEQLRGERPTTASDQWQLGALVFEVLCGTPLRREGEQHVPAPSQRALASGDTNAADFGTDARGLARALRGDLDAIVSKALDDTPERRYAGVAELARELRDWLAGRPIASRRHERWYAARRFASTHRWALGSAVVALLALVAGGAASLVAGQRAQAQARIAERTSVLLSEMFVSNHNAPNLATMTLREFFSHAIDTALADTQLPAEQRSDLLYDLRIRAQEVRALEAAERAARGMLAAAPQVHGAQSLYVAAAHDAVASSVLMVHGRRSLDEAASHLAAAEAMYRALGLLDNPEYLTTHMRETIRLEELRGDSAAMVREARRGVQQIRQLKIGMYLNFRPMLVDALAADGQWAEAAAEADDTLAMAEAAVAETPAIANMLDWLRAGACKVRARSDPPSALTLCGDLVAALERDGRLQTRIGARALSGLGHAHANSGDVAAALDDFRRAERELLALEGLDSDSREVQDVRRAIGRQLHLVDRTAEAIDIQRAALGALEDRLGASHPDALALRIELVESLMAVGLADDVAALVDARLDASSLKAGERSRWDALLVRRHSP